MCHIDLPYSYHSCQDILLWAPKFITMDFISSSPRIQVAILDFGSQYSHLIARRVRELNVFCELHSCLTTAEELTLNRSICGIILSGG